MSQKAVVFLVVSFYPWYCFGQSGNAGTIRGSVLDPSGGVVKGAAVEIQNPVSHYSRAVQSDAQGSFEFDNVPYNPYHLTVAASGFQTFTQDVDVRSSVTVPLKISLKIGESTTSVSVVAAGDLVENDSVAHTDVDRGLFDKLPLESASSSLSSTPTAFSMDWAITLRIHFRWMANLSPTSRAKYSRIRFQSMQCSLWK
jgi:hypothetical protein